MSHPGRLEDARVELQLAEDEAMGIGGAEGLA
jgi:hypothetical protein